MKQKQNAIVTWASGELFLELPEFKVFLSSIERLSLKCYVFTHDMPSEKENELLDRGFDVVRFSGDDIHMVVRDRFLEIYRWLLKNSSDLNHVILTDSKDVVFQTNPFECDKRVFGMELIPQKLVFLCHEGGKHYQSEWNATNQIKFQMNVGEFKQKFTNSPIINSGFIYGHVELIRNLSFLIWSNSITTAMPISEQATLNYLYFYLKDDPAYVLLEPEKTALCATGEGVKQNWLDFVPAMKDGLLYHPVLKTPYAAFHQWERTIHKDEIMEKYL